MITLVHRLVPALLFSGALLSFATIAHANTSITGNITTNTTWSTAGNEYVVQNDISIDSGVTLTIDPGVVVKLKPNVAITVNGTLSALGSTSSPITITASSTVTSATDRWRKIIIAVGGTATFDHVDMTYGGYTNTEMVRNQGGYLTVTNSLIASSTHAGIVQTAGTSTISFSDVRNNTYGISGDSKGWLTINDTTFTSNTTAAYANLISSIIVDHANNTAIGGTYNGMYLPAVNLGRNATWTADTMPFIVNDLIIPSGKALHLEEGTVLKVTDDSRIEVNGRLTGEGAELNKVYITSYMDDSVLGNTNGDGTTVPGATDHWLYIDVNAGGSLDLDHTNVYYGGSAGVRTDGGLSVIDNSKIASSTTNGIYTKTGTTTVRNSEIAYQSGGLASDNANGKIYSDNNYVHHNTYNFYVFSGNADIASTTISNGTFGVYSYVSNVNVDVSEIRNNTNGIDVTDGSVIVEGSQIHDNTYGVYVNSGVPKIESNYIYANSNRGVFKGSSPSAIAQYNYWGTSTPSVGGSGSDVSTNVDYTPYLSEWHFLNTDNSGNLIDSVDFFDDIDWWGDPSPYEEAWYRSINLWNSLGNVSVATDTIFTDSDLEVATTSRSDVVWAAVWQYDSSSDDTITLNGYFLSDPSYTLAHQINAVAHELGHALGLDHSYRRYDGNIMHYQVFGTSTLGWQDLSDYYYLWP